ncbi:MAG TPA: aminoacetone oxidase family FAD-binding enzyme [Coriobacteriia bacterium]|nr:aminoacetone oxidase family FAD-binding enzyme [Coriobacteriia bacterium]
MPHVAIIGAGPAGLTAACAAASLGARVTLLEGGPRVGRKILASGNGRCNLSNTAIMREAYNQPDFVAPVLTAVGVDQLRDYFTSLGLSTYADSENRVYPTSNVANSVLDVLRLEAAHLGVKTRLNLQVKKVTAVEGGGFEMLSTDGDRVSADYVIVSTGGGTSLLADFGHTIVPFSPVLGPIRTSVDTIKRLSGIRVRCSATLLDVDGPDGRELGSESGELLFRDYGASGIMIFDLSRALEGATVLKLDFFPSTPAESLRELFTQRADELSWRTIETFLDGLTHHILAQALIAAADLDPAAKITVASAEALARIAKDFRLEVLGAGEAKQAQVTRGGADVSEFDPGTLESKLVPGVFAAGEVLDVDGRCGGYNLHWAWASGLVAGAVVAQKDGAV